MPVQTPLKPVLETAIVAAFTNAATSGAIDGANPTVVIQDLAKQISDAIDTYIKGIVVTVTVAPGIPVSTAGTPAAQTGATTGPGTGTS